MDLSELQAALEEALAAEGPEVSDGVAVRAEEHEEGLDAVTTVVVLWLVQRVAGKVLDKSLDAVWARISDRLRARKGSDVLEVIEEEPAYPRDASG